MNSYFKTLQKASLLNLFLGGCILFLEEIFSFPKIQISPFVAFVVFFAMIIVYGFVVFEVIMALPPKARGKHMVTHGPYSKIRHPLYAAIIFILNPAIAILLRSYFLMLGIIPAYFLWKVFIKEEERGLVHEFGSAYTDYKKITPMLFPALGAKRSLKYLGLFVLFFLIALFFFDNAENLWDMQQAVKKELTPPERTVYNGSAPLTAGKKESISTPVAEMIAIPEPSGISETVSGTKLAQKSAPNGGLSAQIFERELDIEKLGVKAPIVLSRSDDEKYINDLLAQGIVSYPGYKLPEEGGPTVLIGHSSVYPWIKTKYGTVFATLNKLVQGDKIVVYSGGKEFDYSVVRSEVVPYGPDNYKKLENISNSTLVLITCWPPGTTKSRFLVFAGLSGTF